jgi:hypothetical protein
MTKRVKSPHEIIIEMFQGTVFTLTFESEDIMGFRSSSETDTLRAFSINLRRQTVEYELKEKGAPVRHRIEYSPGLELLIKKLPLTSHAFDLKFQGMRLTEHGVSVAERVSLAENDDPWDMTSYFERSRAGKLREKTDRRLVNKKLR